MRASSNGLMRNDFRILAKTIIAAISFFFEQLYSVGGVSRSGEGTGLVLDNKLGNHKNQGKHKNHKSQGKQVPHEPGETQEPREPQEPGEPQNHNL